MLNTLRQSNDRSISEINKISVAIKTNAYSCSGAEIIQKNVCSGLLPMLLSRVLSSLQKIQNEVYYEFTEDVCKYGQNTRMNLQKLLTEGKVLNDD